MRSSLTRLQIAEGLQQAGLGSGDTVFLHIDTMIAALIDAPTLQEKLNTLLSAFQDVLSSTGTLIVPTFTYSFCKQQVFDPKKTMCEVSEMGIFPNFFLGQPGVQRTLDPIFSVGLWGARAPELTSVSYSDSFGKNSIFDRVHELNAKIVCLGCSLDRSTFIHYCEKKVGISYRYDKIFKGQIVTKDGHLDCETIYFVRDRDKKLTTDLTLLKNNLRNKNRIQLSEISRIGVYMVHAKDFFDEVALILRRDPLALTKPDLS